MVLEVRMFYGYWTRPRLDREVTSMKSTMLLATALFLISAPAPDSNDIAEMTMNFIILDDASGLLAADELPDRQDGIIQPSHFDQGMDANRLSASAEHDDKSLKPAG